MLPVSSKKDAGWGVSQVDVLLHPLRSELHWSALAVMRVLGLHCEGHRDIVKSTSAVKGSYSFHSDLKGAVEVDLSLLNLTGRSAPRR